MLIIVIGRFFQIILAFLTVKLATTLLTPAAYGQMSQLVALTSGFTLVLVNPVGMFINRRLHTWELQGKVPQYFMRYGLYLLLICFFSAFFISVVNYFSPIIDGMHVIWIIIIVCLSLFFNTANQTFIPSLNLLDFRNWFVVLTLATLIASLILSVFICYILAAAPEYWQLGQVLGQAILGIVAGIIFFRLLKPAVVQPHSSHTSSGLVTLITFAWPLAFSVGLTWLQSQSYRFTVSNEVGLTALGLFVAGYGISAAIIASFESVLTTYFLPKFYRQIASNDNQQQIQAWQQYAEAVLPALLLTSAFIIGFAHELTQILLGSKFQAAWSFVIWGAFAEAGRVIVATYAFIAHARMKTYSLLLPNLIGAVSALILLKLLTPLFNIEGVGIALTGASAVVILAMHIILRKQLPITLPWQALAKALLYIVGIMALLLLANLLFGATISVWEALIKLAGFGLLYLVSVYGLIYKTIKVS